MKREELLLRFAGVNPESHQDNDLSLSSHVIRAPSLRLVTVGCDAPEEAQIYGLLDAIHWRRWRLQDSDPITFSWHSAESDEQIAEPLSTLCSVLPGDLGIEVQRDFLPFEPVSAISNDRSADRIPRPLLNS